jgi:Domain of unknown function (DUF202)
MTCRERTAIVPYMLVRGAVDRLVRGAVRIAQLLRSLEPDTTVPSVLDSGTRLAMDRTRLAYERTMMAWIRTAASLISFGFTIYKFFQLEIKATAPNP